MAQLKREYTTDGGLVSTLYLTSGYRRISFFNHRGKLYMRKWINKNDILKKQELYIR